MRSYNQPDNHAIRAGIRRMIRNDATSPTWTYAIDTSPRRGRVVRRMGIMTPGCPT